MTLRVAAGMDIGSNTLRLLIAEADIGARTLTPLLRSMRITRLSEGMPKQGGRFIKEAMERSFPALQEFSRIMEKHQVQKSCAVGTWVFRVAANKEDFLNRIKQDTGIDINVISAEQEAALSLKGIARAHPQKHAFLSIDIGGGSTEFILSDAGGKLLRSKSSSLGVVNIAERHITTDPPDDEALNAMQNEIKIEVDSVAQEILTNTRSPKALIGTAGTATTLASLALGLTEYEPDRIDRARLSLDKLKEIYSSLTKMTFSERAELKPLQGGREDLIIPGAYILISAIKAFGFEAMAVSDAGLLEGIIIDNVFDNGAVLTGAVLTGAVLTGAVIEN